MKTRTETIVFNNCNFKLDIYEETTATPDCSEIMQYVGLSEMGIEMFDKTNQLMYEDGVTKGIRFAAYTLDISEKRAYVKILKYYIVFFGLTSTYSRVFVKNDNLMELEFFTDLVKLFTEPTYEVLNELFAKEGFVSKKVEESMIQCGFFPKAQIILSEDKYSLK